MRSYFDKLGEYNKAFILDVEDMSEHEMTRCEGIQELEKAI